MKKAYIYMGGMIVLGAFYQISKDWFSQRWLHLVLSLALILVVRLIAERFGKP